MINKIIDRFDNEDHEYEIRWAMFKMKWFPYRTAEFLGYDKKTLELELGPWKWNKPNVLRRKRV